VVVLVALALTAGKKKREQRHESQRVEARGHRDEAHLRGARADKEEAAAQEQKARAERERAEAEERAAVARREREASEHHAGRAEEVDPDR